MYFVSTLQIFQTVFEMRQCLIKTAADMEAGHIVCSASINMEFHAEQAAVCLINDTIHEKLVKKPT